MAGRARGSDATILLRFNDGVYGAAPVLDTGEHYLQLPAVKFGLSESDSLEPDPELGMGRDAQDPARGPLDDAGDVEVVADTAYFGYWLHLLFGAATVTAVKATGSIAFAANPGAGDTITLDGVAWTFVDSGASGPETNIAGTLALTLAQLKTDLNGSADSDVAAATYDVTGNTTLTVSHDTAGAGGNAFTLAASDGTVSGATLAGGGWTHVWESGAATLPDAAIEIGNPNMDEPSFSLHTGVKANTLAITRARTGSVHATIGLIAQAETIGDATVDSEPVEVAGRRKFQQQRGAITRDGSALGNVTAGSFTLSNGLEAVETVDRTDGRISGIDEGEFTASGEVTARFADRTLLDLATADTPIQLSYAFTHAGGGSLTFAFPRVHLPKPKRPIDGPGGIEATFAWAAAGDRDAAEPLVTATLFTDAISDFGDFAELEA